MAAVPVVFDTDIGTDVDDALALALLVRHPDFHLRAVTTVSGDTERRARIARKLLHLAGRDDVEVAVGLRGEQSHPERSAEAGHEDAMLGDFDSDFALSPRSAVDVLIGELRGGETQLVTVGMQSNLAAALDADPELAGRAARVTVMGGVFEPLNIFGRQAGAAVDHNLNVDQPASLRSLNAGLKVLFVPCDVTFGTWLLRAHVDRLRAGDALCRELARQIDIWRERLVSGFGTVLPSDHMCLLHDPLAVACMVERRFVETRRAPVSVAMHKGLVRTFIDPLEGTDAEIVTAVDGPAFADWWLTAVLRD
jgi:purine nucleosidase